MYKQSSFFAIAKFNLFIFFFSKTKQKEKLNFLQSPKMEKPKRGYQNLSRNNRKYKRWN